MNRAVACAASLITAIAGLGLAVPAQADQIWYQSVQRNSASSTCEVSSVIDIARGWNNWSGSWEQWANGGRGGWTCTRNVTWARDSIESPTSSGAGCVLADTQFNTYANFGAQYSLAAGAPAYVDAACTNGIAFYTNDLVYATSLAAADLICVASLGGGFYAAPQIWTGTNIYVCFY
jgi:hypothetical protein